MLDKTLSPPVSANWSSAIWNRVDISASDSTMWYTVVLQYCILAYICDSGKMSAVVPNIIIGRSHISPPAGRVWGVVGGGATVIRPTESNIARFLARLHFPLISPHLLRRKGGNNENVGGHCFPSLCCCVPMADI